MNAAEWLDQQGIVYLVYDTSDTDLQSLVPSMLEDYAAHCLAEKEQQLERARQLLQRYDCTGDGCPCPTCRDTADFLQQKGTTHDPKAKRMGTGHATG